MANIKSQIKRIKTNEKARLRNKAVKSSLKTAIRKAREARLEGRHPQEPGRQQEVGACFPGRFPQGLNLR